MPSAEEFGNSDVSHGVGAPPNIESLKARARQIREAQARNVPIPNMGQTTAPARVSNHTAYSRPDFDRSVPPSSTTYVSNSGDDELEMVRRRFKLANYYEALLEQPAFGEDTYSDEYACTVQSELTEWVKGRMSELVGIRNNPEGFLDDEVQLLKSFVKSLGPNGIRALNLLADKVLNPSVPQAPVAPPPPVPVPEPEPVEEYETGSSAMDFSAIVPEPPPPQPAKKQIVRVRRAHIPGAPNKAPAPLPQLTPTAEPLPKRRGRPPRDPLAAGRAMMASMTPETATVAPQAQPAPTAPEVQPVPMPKGMGMSIAMQDQAERTLRNAQLIQATGGGVL